MHPDDLKVIWQCKDCGRGFLFHSDMVAHENESRHRRIATMNMPSSATGRLQEFYDGNLVLDFRIAGTLAKMLIRYRHFPSLDRVVYRDVEYSDKRLKDMVETQPVLMAKIDSFLRNKLMRANDNYKDKQAAV